MRILQMIRFLLPLLVQITVALTVPLPSSFLPKLLGHDNECRALLLFSNSFIISGNASKASCDYFSPVSYPKTASWTNGTDCCTWDGVACDGAMRNVIGLDLSCSWLQGTLPSNSTLFLLRHLRRLNLAGNDFGGSHISPRFGIFTSMTHLNLSRSELSGLVPLEVSYLSQLLTLDLTGNFGTKHPPRLEDKLLRRFVQNLTDLRELVLDLTDMSSISPDSIRNMSSSLTLLSIIGSSLRGRLPTSIFHLPNLRNLNLAYNFDLEGTLPIINWTTPLVSMDLSLTKFHGKLANSVVNLKYVEELRLGGCQFDGPIPASVGNLTNLNSLDLSNNSFTGHIPQTIGNLEALTILDLSSNNLSIGSAMEFEIMFSKLKNLKLLWLPSKLHLSLHNSGNCSFPKLELLVLSDCSLTKFPYFLRSLKELRLLDLSSNMIDGQIPQWFWTIGIDSLEFLSLSDNKVTEVMSQFPWKSLNFADLRGNFLEGRLPALPPSISSFDASNNSFSGDIPSSFCGASSLEDLNLSNNNLSGTLPECFGNLGELELLDLSANQLEGPLPRSLANCTRLFDVDISKNEIFDTFPNWLIVPSLRSLDLRSNKFHGFIGSETNPLSLAQLENFIVSDNNFSGLLPANLFVNSSLKIIDISGNRFKGSVPILPPTIGFFSLSGNEFTGEIPSSICNATGLEVINLSNNSMRGPIPRCLANSSSSLLVVNLRINKFVGRIPESFFPGSRLTSIDLSQNQLSGTLPRSLANCKNVEVLDLGDNKLEDRFPVWLDALPKLQVLVLRSNRLYGPVNCSKNKDHPFVKLRILDLSGNKFSGPLPTTIIIRLDAMKDEGKGGLQYMDNRRYGYQDSVKVIMKGAERELVRILTVFTTIDMSRNSFEGVIPEAIGNLKALKGLNFSCNALSGNIPSSIGNLTNLEWLDLSSNKLMGQIPTTLANLASLSYLNLSVNQLTGSIPQSTQFDTFNSDSFDGNHGLCGHPLPNACGDDAHPPSASPGEEEAEYGNRIEWTVVVMGYGCGLVIGISAGYIVLVNRRLDGWCRWLRGNEPGKQAGQRELLPLEITQAKPVNQEKTRSINRTKPMNREELSPKGQEGKELLMNSGIFRDLFHS